MLARTVSNQLLSKLMAISLSLLAPILVPLSAFSLEEKSDTEMAGSSADSVSPSEMEKQLALPLDNLEDIGYTLQRVQQQAIDLYIEATRKRRESKVISKCLVIPHEKLQAESHYQPLRKAWLVFFVGTMEPLVQLLVHDVHEVEAHLTEVKVMHGKKKQFEHVYAKWREAITSINRHLDVLAEQINSSDPSNIIVATEAREIDMEIIKAMQLRMRAYAILAEAGPVGKAN